MDITPQRGAIAIDLDRTRLLFFDLSATWLLIQKYGHGFIAELSTLDKDRNVELKSLDVLAYFLFAGLQAEAKQRGEDVTLEQAQEFLRPYTYLRVFRAVILALNGAASTPDQPGKLQAAEPAAKPAVDTPPDPEKGPGPTKVSTSMKRSASRSRSSTGGRKRSGR